MGKNFDKLTADYILAKIRGTAAALERTELETYEAEMVIAQIMELCDAIETEVNEDQK